MAIKSRFLIMIIFALLAAVSYVVGSGSGPVIFIGLGVVFEMMFWFNLFKRN